jgi:hypothetical protein
MDDDLLCRAQSGGWKYVLPVEIAFVAFFGYLPTGR